MGARGQRGLSVSRSVAPKYFLDKAAAKHLEVKLNAVLGSPEKASYIAPNEFGDGWKWPERLLIE